MHRFARRQPCTSPRRTTDCLHPAVGCAREPGWRRKAARAFRALRGVRTGVVACVMATGWAHACDVLTISSAAELQQMATSPSCLDASIGLLADVDLSGNPWTPMGTHAAPFTGTFDGNGFAISNFAIDREGSEAAAGFFGALGNGATITNVSLTEVTIFDDDTRQVALGTLAGVVHPSSTVSILDVTVDASPLSGTDAVGGLVGRVRSAAVTLSGVDVTVDVYGDDDVGGVVGSAPFHSSESSLVMRSVTARGTVMGAGSNVGGVVGYVNGSVDLRDVRHVGTVTSHATRAGGLVGSVHAEATVQRVRQEGAVHADGDATSTDGYAGGLIGFVKDAIVVDDAVTVGDVTAGWGYVGGHVGSVGTGLQRAVLHDAHHEGNVRSGGDYVGGLLGAALGDLDATDVSVVGDVTEANPLEAGFVGGIAGFVYGEGSLLRADVTGNVRGTSQVGGLMGAAQAFVSVTDGSWSSGTVSATEAGQAGGIIGRATGGLTGVRLEARGNVSGVGTFVGGIVGRAFAGAELTDVTHVGDVDAATGNDVAGVVGSTSGPFSATDVTHEGSVTAGGERAAGVVATTAGDVRLSGATVRGAVTSDAGPAGGLFAWVMGDASIDDVTLNHASMAEEDSSVRGRASVGGVAGSVLGSLTLTNASLTNDVHGEGHEARAGGVVGDVDQALSMTDVHHVGSVSGTQYAGGLVGRVDASLVAERASHEGPVTSEATGLAYAGGIAGRTNDAVALRTVSSTGAVTSSGRYAGGVIALQNAVGTVLPELVDVAFDGDVRAEEYAGGLVGYAWSGVSVTDARVAGSVATTGSTDLRPSGGLVGSAIGAAWIRNAYVTARIVGSRWVGGLVGLANGEVDARDVRVSTSVSGGSLVGGLLGSASLFTIERSNFEGSVTSTGSTAGGLVGYVDAAGSTIVESYASGSVEATGSLAPGGLVGGSMNALTIRDSYARVDVTGAAQVGGLVGLANGVTVTDAYAAGTIASAASQGGLVGVNQTGSVVADAAYWDVDRAGVSTTTGEGTGIATSALRTFATFESEWDVVEGWEARDASAGRVWGMCSRVQDGDPFLLWAFDEDPCASVLTSIDVTGVDGEVLRNTTFDVTVTLRDQDGTPWRAEQATTVTLRAEGGVGDGSLRDANAPESDASVVATVTAGASSVTFEDVFHDGSSREQGGDVTLVATVDGPAGEVRGVSAPFSVRDVTMEVTADRMTLPADGSEVARITVRLAAVDGEGVAGQAIRFATTLGAFVGAERELVQGVERVTNEEGVATVDLRAARQVGTAIVTALCPGACPRTVEIEFVGASSEPLVIAGNEKAWLYPPTFDAVIAGISYRIDGGGVVTVDGDGVPLPLRIDGLENGVAYELEVRGETESGSLPWSDPMLVVPDVVVAPLLAMQRPDEASGPFPVERVGERERIRVPLVVRNDDDDVLPRAWLLVTPPEGMEVVAIEPAAGRVTREATAWFWRDGNLAPGSSATFEVVLELLDEGGRP